MTATPPTAMVVDAHAADRGRVAQLLRLCGWDVQEVAGTRDALRVARRADLDLVVTDLAGAGEGPALLRRLRLVGCHAHLLVVTGDADGEDRAAAVAAGALACLQKPVDAGLLLGALGARTGGTPPVDDDPAEDAVDPDLMHRLQALYARALPARLTAIADGARTGDATALASASTALAGTSAQLGHPEVAAVCAAIARDARRGILAHDLVGELRAVAGD